MSLELLIVLVVVLGFIAIRYWPRSKPKAREPSGRPATNPVTPEPTFDGPWWTPSKGFNFNIVGEGSYQDALSSIVGGHCLAGWDYRCEALIVPDPQNKHDENAVRVTINLATVGFLSRDDNRKYLDALRSAGLDGRPVACWATIIGGFIEFDEDDEEELGHFGVRLSLKRPFEIAT